MSNEFNIELGIQAKQSDIDSLLKKINAKVGNIDIGLHISNDWLEKIHSKLSNIKLTPDVDTTKIESGIKKTNELWDKSKKSIKFSPEIDQQSYQTFQNRIKEIEKSATSLGNINISTDSSGNISKAVMSYTDEVGRAIRETMAWETESRELENELLKINTFKTTKIDYSDNIAQTNKLTDSIINLQIKLTDKVSNLKLGNFSDGDIAKFDEIRDKVYNITDISQKSVDALKQLGNELENVIKRSDFGDVKTDTGLSFASSKEDIAQYMASLHKLKLEQISVKEHSPITLETGERIKKTTVLVEEGKNKWREYTTAISSTDNEVRILQGNLKNVNSNLANNEEIIIARLKSKIANFQSEIGGKIANIKLGDIAPQDLASLDKLQVEINEITTDTDNAEQEIRRFKKTFAELADTIKRGKLVDENTFGVGVGSSNEEYKAYIANLKDVSAEQIKIEQSYIRFGKNQEVLKVVNSLVDEGEGNWRKYQHTFNATTEDVRELDKGLKDVNTTSIDLGKNAMRMVGYFVSFGTVVSLLKSAFNDMKAIDTQLTNLSKVTDLVRENFRQAALEAVDAGNKWGRTAQDYLEASTTFAQAGAENYKQLADISILAQSAGGLTADLASDYLVATNAAFQLGNNAEKLTEILDGQNQVSNRSATEMKEMAEATKVYANTASIAGESAQTMTALIATGVSATKRSGSEVGTALRTLSMNIRQIKGETENGLIDEASMAKAEEALRSIGVRTRYLKDGIVELKTPTAVLGELAEKFTDGEISAERLAVILEDVGGKRQADILAGMIQNWSLYGKAMSDYADSTGSAAREAQKDLESWEGKLNILSNTWTGFVAKTIDSEWAKRLLDTGAGLLNLFDNLGNAVIVFGGAFTLLKADKIASTFNNIFESFKNVGRLNITRASHIFKNVA